MLPLLRFVQVVIGPVLKLLYRIRCSGVENLPEGGAVVVSNHLTAMDPVFLGCVLPRGFRSMAKAEIFKNPIAAFFVRKLGGFPVNRGAGDMGALNTAKNYVDAGDLLLIFPEGTRSKTGEMARLKPGALLIALRTGAPIIPAYITPRGGKIKMFKGLAINFGEPVDAGVLFPGADLNDLKRSDYRNADEKLREIMLALKAEDMQ